jgi:hypothetical protein
VPAAGTLRKLDTRHRGGPSITQRVQWIEELHGIHANNCMYRAVSTKKTQCSRACSTVGPRLTAVQCNPKKKSDRSRPAVYRVPECYCFETQCQARKPTVKDSTVHQGLMAPRFVQYCRSGGVCTGRRRAEALPVLAVTNCGMFWTQTMYHG